MKRIVLSADGDRMVYLVPDEVAEQLERYCDRFWTWMQQSPHAAKYRVGGCCCYNECILIPTNTARSISQMRHLKKILNAYVMNCIRSQE